MASVYLHIEEPAFTMKAKTDAPLDDALTKFCAKFAKKHPAAAPLEALEASCAQSVALLPGTLNGPALELALACTYRVGGAHCSIYCANARFALVQNMCLHAAYVCTFVMRIWARLPPLQA